MTDPATEPASAETDPTPRLPPGPKHARLQGFAFAANRLRVMRRTSSS